MTTMTKFNLRQTGKDVSQAILQLSLIQVIAGATLFLLAFWGFENVVTRLAVQLALLAVVLRPATLESPALWIVLSIVNTYALLDAWYIADNHKFLMVYWIYVVTLAVSVSNRELAEKILVWHGRFFLVFVFCMAALQKALSPTYMSGEMFEMRLLIDERFRAFGHLFGVDKATSGAAYDLAERLKNPLAEFDGNAAILPTTDHTRMLSLIITWYDVIIQLAIGLLFIPARRLTDQIGHYATLFFIFTTYLPAPVYSFGWLIATYGLCVSWKKFPYLYLVYMASFVAILFYRLPWRGWVLSW